MITVGDFRIGKKERIAINQVLDSGRISEGQKVREFEKSWAEYIGTKYAIALNSGTSALIAGLSALKHLNYISKEKPKVITTPLSYIATSNAIVLNQLEPVFVDINPQTFVIPPANIKALLEKTGSSEYSVILPVHLMGYPCDMNKINKIAKKYDLITFEDSAQAHGTCYMGKKMGSLSLLSAFSFYIAHNIQAGELGAINTDNYEIIKTIKRIKANGRACDCPVCTRNTTGCPKIDKYDGDPRFTHDIIGYNFKAMEFQAALALTQIENATQIKMTRNENVKYLNDGLDGLDEIKLPVYSKDVSYLAYPIVCKSVNRKKLMMQLESKGIETRPLFGCISLQPAYKFLRNKYKEKLPNAEYIGANCFYIGCHQYLTQDDLEYIIKTFKEIL